MVKRYAQQCMNPNYEVMKKHNGILFQFIEFTANQNTEKTIVYSMDGTTHNLPFMPRANVALH